MSVANRLPKGSLPYLQNPLTGRVMIATPEKLARLGTDGKPFLIPCESPEGPGKATVTTAKVVKPEANNEPTPPSEETKELESNGGDDLLTLVMNSDDKDELVGYGKNLGVKLTRAMNVSTMQNHLSVKIAELDALR